MVQTCALVGYYAASSGNSLPTIRDNLSAPSSRIKQGQGRVKNSCPCLTPEDGADGLSRNVGKGLPILAA
jgi:hypothetical protein